MRSLKMLALAAVAVGAFMAFIGAGTASATVLCSTTVETCPSAQRLTGTLDFTIAAGSSALLVNTKGEELDKCSTSTVKGPITNSGSSTATVSATVESLTWESCTFPTKTLTTGELEIHKIVGTSNGTVTVKSPFDATINTVFFGSCIYGFTSGASIGDLTEGNPAIFHANGVAERKSGSAFACPETAKWTATYTLTEPATTVSVSTG